MRDDDSIDALVAFLLGVAFTLALVWLVLEVMA